MTKERSFSKRERELNNAAATLSSAWSELSSGEARYAAAGEELRSGRQQITEGEAELAQARTTLEDGYSELESAKTTVRGTIRTPLEDFFGADIIDRINWAGDDTSIDPDDPEATATLLPITQDIIIDLNKSLAGNAADIINLLLLSRVTEEELIEAVEITHGVIQLLPEETPTGAIMRMLEEEYAAYNDQYELLASSARTWDTGHADYIDGVERIETAKTEYAEGLSEYNAARTTLDNGWSSYNSGSAQYSAGYSEYNAKKSEYEEGLAKYNDGVKKLAEGFEELKKGELEYKDGLAEYEKGSEKLEEARKLFNEKYEEYSNGLKELSKGLKLLEDGEKDYADGRKAYEDGTVELEEAGELYEEKQAEYNDGVVKLAEGLALLEENEAKYANGLRDYRDGKKKFDESMELYLSGRADYEAALETFLSKSDEYGSGRRKYEEALAAYHNGMREYEDGLKEIERAKKELADGEVKYRDGLEEYEEAARKLEDAKEKMAGLADCRWLVLDPAGNASYQFIKSGSGNISDMGTTFAMIFILVGALVIYSTLGRIVEEQRRIIGATRALGLYKREILAKYLIFGVGATVLGMLVGTALGYFLLQPILTVNYGKFYKFPNEDRAFVWYLTLAVLIGGIVLSVIAVWSACTELTRSSATSLMQEKVPAVKGKTWKWTEKMSLYSRLIIMNIRTDMKRVVVTIVSVAGSCALLLGGFTMRNGIIEAIGRQFTEKTLFDYNVSFEEDDKTPDNLRRTIDQLDREGAKAYAVRNETVVLTIDGQIDSGILLCGDMKELDDVFPFWEKYRKNMPFDKEGIYIGKKMAENYNLKVGDTITVLDANMLPFDVKVAGIFLNYIGRQIAMSRETYEDVFKTLPKDNALLVSDNKADKAVVTGILNNADGLVSIETTESTYDNAMGIASVLNLIAVLFIAIAGIMAGFILLNIINMHLSQKKKELTIMRINGFTVREVIAYIAREAIVTTIIGIIAGVGAGMFLGYRVLRLIGGKSSIFVQEPLPWSIILAVVITVGFSVVINAVALKKVRYLKLTDI
ncbi:MAG: hypothetical protein K6E62_05320 [Lachnospiraceae bacterium]|nr:hypothetical protein [Lachnospiraceae bacterium]